MVFGFLMLSIRSAFALPGPLSHGRSSVLKIAFLGLAILLLGATGGALSREVEQRWLMKPQPATKQGVMRATELQIVNDQGLITGLIGTIDGGGAILLKNALGGLDKAPPLVMGIDDSGAGIVRLNDADGNNRIGLGSDNDGGSFELLDSKQNVSMWGYSYKEEGVLRTYKKTAPRFDSRNGTVAASSIPGDLDMDGDVDFADFLTFAQNFGRTS